MDTVSHVIYIVHVYMYLEGTILCVLKFDMRIGLKMPILYPLTLATCTIASCCDMYSLPKQCINCMVYDGLQKPTMFYSSHSYCNIDRHFDPLTDMAQKKTTIIFAHACAKSYKIENYYN